MALSLLSPLAQALAPPFSIGESGNAPPVADFSWTALLLAVTFADESSDPDGSIQSWAWNFGDGNASTERHPAHVYATPGDYSVSLSVEDDLGATDLIIQTVTVAGPVVATAPYSGSVGIGARPIVTLAIDE